MPGWMMYHNLVTYIYVSVISDISPQRKLNLFILFINCSELPKLHYKIGYIIGTWCSTLDLNQHFWRRSSCRTHILAVFVPCFSQISIPSRDHTLPSVYKWLLFSYKAILLKPHKTVDSRNQYNSRTNC